MKDYKNKNSCFQAEKMTDMIQVRNLAKTFLMLAYRETPFSPMVIQHPFTSSGIVSIPKDGTMQLVNITESQENLSAWQKFIGEVIDQTESVHNIRMMFRTAYVLTFLKYAAPYLSTTDFSKILADAWMLSESPNQDANVSRKELTAMFKDADRNIMMTDRDKELFDSLDESITVYRGVTNYNGTHIRALSWTLSYETAKWFSERFHQDGVVYEATIDKNHILAVFIGRDESEIIVDPKYLQDIQEVPQQGFDMKMS